MRVGSLLENRLERMDDVLAMYVEIYQGEVRKGWRKWNIDIGWLSERYCPIESDSLRNV